MHRLVFALAFLVACVAQDAQDPTPDDIDQIDHWAETSDGKADLPGSWSELVAWIRDLYRNRLSAVWANQEHPPTADAAIARVRGLIAQGGVADPAQRTYRTTVQRYRFSDLADHSEINIVLPGGKTMRLIGDPKGAGLFVDAKPFQTALAPALCLTWDEVQTAIETSYLAGAYGADFVCHTVTERVLRSLKVGSARFTAQIHSFSIARFLWGPSLPSGNSQDPSTWDESRACN